MYSPETKRSIIMIGLYYHDILVSLFFGDCKDPKYDKHIGLPDVLA